VSRTSQPSRRSALNRLLLDPLLHFLLAGALLFAVHAVLSDGGEAPPDRIVVGEADVARLAETFERTWQRPPTQKELRGLVDDFVTEEVLCREALALGLDRNDLVVRRRMRQKMEFLTADLAGTEPSEAQLVAHLRAHPEPFEIPPRTSFTQVFVDREGVAPDAGTAPEVRAAALLDRLRRAGPPGEVPAEAGDATLLPSRLERVPPREIEAQLGRVFAEAVGSAPVGEWSGPLRSAFGLHLVYVESREPARLPALQEVRARVEADWQAERREQARERFHGSLREGYEIVVPEGLDATASRTAQAP